MVNVEENKLAWALSTEIAARNGDGVALRLTTVVLDVCLTLGNARESVVDLLRSVVVSFGSENAVKQGQTEKVDNSVNKGRRRLGQDGEIERFVDT